MELLRYLLMYFLFIGSLIAIGVYAGNIFYKRFPFEIFGGTAPVRLGARENSAGFNRHFEGSIEDFCADPSQSDIFPRRHSPYLDLPRSFLIFVDLQLVAFACSAHFGRDNPRPSLDADRAPARARNMLVVDATRLQTRAHDGR